MPSKKNQVTIVVTVLNEIRDISLLLQALFEQTVSPHEIIIVDGGSIDGTFEFLKKTERTNTSLKVISRQGNISQGRNAGIRLAKTEWIACTDAGCIPKKNWLSELLKAAESDNSSRGTQPDVVAGYYFGLPTTAFESAVVPFVLVQPDQFDPNTFLPATRSMLFRKNVWETIGGFREDLEVSEDYVFAQQVKKYGFKMVATSKALVGWRPRSNLQAFVRMVYQQARYDELGGVRRRKVDLLFARYLVGLLLLATAMMLHSKQLLFFMVLVVFAYLFWSIYKHKSHVPKGWVWLPVLQLSSDVAVLLGTSSGLLRLNR